MNHETAILIITNNAAVPEHVTTMRGRSYRAERVQLGSGGKCSDWYIMEQVGAHWDGRYLVIVRDRGEEGLTVERMIEAYRNGAGMWRYGVQG